LPTSLLPPVFPSPSLFFLLFFVFFIAPHLELLMEGGKPGPSALLEGGRDLGVDELANCLFLCSSVDPSLFLPSASQLMLAFLPESSLAFYVIAF